MKSSVLQPMDMHADMDTDGIGDDSLWLHQTTLHLSICNKHGHRIKVLVVWLYAR